MNKSKDRIVNECIGLNKDMVQQFFNLRSDKYEEQNPYVSILYQDNNKELATIRDAHEKQLIVPKLALSGKNCLLDVGCGVGRWADSILESVDKYVGVDFSPTLIECANKRFSGNSKATFIVMDAKEISRKKLDNFGYFDRIIISGVLIYMNDDELIQAFNGISNICSKDCIIYIREPLAYEQRLTLNGYWSNELNANYSAIYRTRDEMYQFIQKAFPVDNYELSSFEEMYNDPSMRNRKETSQFYAIITGRK